MNSRPRAILSGALGLGALVALSACSAGAAPESESQPTLRLAVTDLQGLEELQREFGAFETAFEEVSGYQLDFYAVNDRTAAAAALANDEVDLVFTGPAEYVVLHDNTDAEPIIAISRPTYRSCIYTTAESGITELGQLTGTRIAMTDVGSTSGHLGPSQILVDAGLDPMNDLEVLTIGDTVHEALVRGDVQAAGVGCHDYEEFVAAEEDPAAFPLLAEGDTLPADVIVARAGLDDAIVEDVRTAFEENWDTLLAAMLEGADNAKYSDAELVEASDESYDVVRSMYRAIGVDDFSEFVGD